MTITTTTEIAGPVNRVYNTRLLKDARPRCPYMIGSRPGDVLPSHRGSFTMIWRRYDNLTPSTSALSELTGAESYPFRSSTQLSVTDTTATLAKYGQHAFVTEEVDLVNFSQEASEIVDVFAVVAGRSLCRLHRNTLEDNATLVYADGASADAGVNSPISRGLLESVINTLDRNSAMAFLPMTTGSQNIGTTPMLPAFWGLCHSDVAIDISKLSGFKGVETYAGQTATEAGEFGAITVGGMAVRFISSPEASADTDSGAAPPATVRSNAGAAADLYTTVIFGMNAHGAISLDADMVREIYKAGDRVPPIQMISHGRGTSGALDPLNEIATTGYKLWYAGLILDSNWIRGVRTAATKLA